MLLACEILEVLGGDGDFADLAALAERLHRLIVNFQCDSAGIANNQVEGFLGCEAAGHARLQDFAGDNGVAIGS